MTNIALIPLRIGSKSIPKKNIKELAGKPLCAWVIEAAVNCPLIDEVYVSTESKEIAQVVESLKLGVKILSRPAELASDETSTEAVMLHAMQNLTFSTLITIQATSPLLTQDDLTAALMQFNEQMYNSMLSAVRVKRFFWYENGEPINYNPQQRPRRQEFNGTLMENGAFYITQRHILLQQQCRLGGRIGIYEMPDTTGIEIDEPHDWLIVAEILKQRSK